MAEKNCGPCRVCGHDTMENDVAAADVGKEEFRCRRCKRAIERVLMAVLEKAYKFPHNVNLYDLMRKVYGDDVNLGYLKEKEDLIDRKGFTWWYCDLDLPNQKVVARAMLDRYGEKLEQLMNVRADGAERLGKRTDEPVMG